MGSFPGCDSNDGHKVEECLQWGPGVESLLMNPEDLNPKLPPLESHQVKSNLGLSADTGDPHNWD